MCKDNNSSKTAQKLPRSCGVLLHITSLPGRCEIGDIGPAAHGFLDFLREAGARYWQFLPLHPTDAGFGDSPYMSFSAFAGNPLLISPELLAVEKLLDSDDILQLAGLPTDSVDFERLIPAKESLLRKAFGRFVERGVPAEFDAFRSGNASWLPDYALFMALKGRYPSCAWNAWPGGLARREASAIKKARHELAAEIMYHEFLQYVFETQWHALKLAAQERGIGLIGDLPIYVGFDSADVWSAPDMFDLDPETLLPAHVAGVPPDYFSETGQRWGNPLYKWRTADDAPNMPVFDWWVARLGRMLDLVDLLRIDHFRGIEAYWEIPAEEKTAINGRWVKGPDAALFEHLQNRLGKLPILAEDLGIITPEVAELRDGFGFPGMKIIQFAFDSGPDNPYLAFNYESPNCVVYTGTHDNDTTVGWFRNAISEDGRNRVREHIGNGPDDDIHWQIIRYALSSTARLAIIPVQDLLGLPSSGRMNTPGLPHGNWRWRCQADMLSHELGARLSSLLRLYRR
ncbi:MAG: 4-alpha-glucanotransferase [Nitrospirae bacterium]|nr:4-alpha-glucanotransferase [Nitrospirota bacterium]